VEAIVLEHGEGVPVEPASSPSSAAQCSASLS
jgi:hypothetical protein